jgi:peptidoglycan biosynthesis protein MviN/MurJ (putative lipid II flippase)
MLIAAGIFSSRIVGLVRERAIATYFGTSAFADVIGAALRAPNVLQNLLGEGTLSASFIPVYSELLGQGRTKEAGRVAGCGVRAPARRRGRARPARRAARARAREHLHSGVRR